MRIRVEIDGRIVLDTNVGEMTEIGKATPYARDEQPPEELLREARARGAQSAGRATYVQDAGMALMSGAPFAERPAATIPGRRTELDAEAGGAVAADVTADKLPRARGAAKSPARLGKKKQPRPR
jgi:hypothetical protein